MAEPPGGDYLGLAVLTHKPWNPESLLWLGCALMLALAPGAAVAGLFEDGSIAQMAANVTVLPVAILVGVTVWFQVNRRFYQTPISLAAAFGFNRRNTGRCLLLGLGTGFCLVGIAMALALSTSLLIQALGDQAEPQKLVTLIAEEAAKPDQTGALVFFVVMAAVVAPVSSISHLDKEISASPRNEESLTERLRETLLGIQHGELDDPYGWVKRIS